MDRSHNSTAWRYNSEEERKLAEHLIGLEKSALDKSCMQTGQNMTCDPFHLVIHPPDGQGFQTGQRNSVNTD